MDIGIIGTVCSFIISMVGIGIVYGKLQANVQKNEEKNNEQTALIDKCATREHLELAVKRADEDRAENKKRIEDLSNRHHDQVRSIARIDTKLESIQKDFSSVMTVLEKIEKRVENLGTKVDRLGEIK